MLQCNKLVLRPFSSSEPPFCRLAGRNCMPPISRRIRLLASKRGVRAVAPRAAFADRLSDLSGLRDNPGNLRARFYRPDGLCAGAPLVVVLHGCTQNAAVYDHGSGWSTLADRHGFALLYPEQQRANNPMLCFNWFLREHTARGRGEAASIRAMIEEMRRLHGIDPARVFITGLSAGGGMASALLAAYPDVFAAGAIIAGLPYGCAADVGEAFECMAGRGRSDAAALGREVRRASSHRGPWPRVQIWQGGADHTVNPSNADTIAGQWASVHALAEQPDVEDKIDGYPRRRWSDAAGLTVVEQYLITGMAHGVPLAAGGDDPVGSRGAHMLEVGLSSTFHAARFFGIAPEPARMDVSPPLAAPRPSAPAVASARAGPQQIIEKALRTAGLMR
jgi:poly(hydroxyalkanoate) depolymerase family esterase